MVEEQAFKAEFVVLFIEFVLLISDDRSVQHVIFLLCRRVVVLVQVDTHREDESCIVQSISVVCLFKSNGITSINEVDHEFVVYIAHVLRHEVADVQFKRILYCFATHFEKVRYQIYLFIHYQSFLSHQRNLQREHCLIHDVDVGHLVLVVGKVLLQEVQQTRFVTIALLNHRQHS